MGTAKKASYRNLRKMFQEDAVYQRESTINQRSSNQRIQEEQPETSAIQTYPQIRPREKKKIQTK